jgi:hypothetical protein
MTARAFWHPLKNPFVGIDVALLPLYRNSFTFQNPEGINRMSFLGPTSKNKLDRSMCRSRFRAV